MDEIYHVFMEIVEKIVYNMRLKYVRCSQEGEYA